MRIQSLTTRFLLTLTLSAVLPVLGLGLYLAYEALREARQRAIEVDLELPGRYAEEELVRRLDLAMSVSERFQQHAEKYFDGEVDVFDFEERVYDEFQQSNVVRIQTVALVDGYGVVEHVVAEGFEQPRFVPESVDDEPWFRKLRDPDNGNLIVWVPRHLSPFRHSNPDRISRDPADYSLGLAFAVSVSSDRGRLGAVLVLISWQSIQEVLDDTVRELADRVANAQAFLLSADRGRYLAHTARDLYGARPAEEVRTAERGDAGALASWQVSPEERAAFADTGGGEEVAILLPSEESPFDWWVGVGVDRRELERDGQSFFRGLLLLIGAATVLLMVWSLIASRAIVRPIARLVRATEALGRGEFDTRVEVPEQGDELADLARAFNRMAEEIASSRDLLAQAERRAAWAEMARQVAHEIKNPLTPMRMGAQLALRARAGGDERWDALAERLARTVISQTDELRRIADDFRAFAGSTSPQARAAELDEVFADDLVRDVEDAFRANAELAGLEFGVRAGAAGASLRGDRGSLRRLLMNLVQNAFDVLQRAEGDADVTSLRVELVAEVDGSGQQVLFRVLDSGPGVPAEIRDRLFEPYFTTRSGGTGLGLAICRRIVEEHGGRIEILDLAAGGGADLGGTEFRVTLPRSEGGDEGGAAGESEPGQSGPAPA